MKTVKKNGDRLKLVSYSALEKRGREIEIKIDNFIIEDFNLLISDNAQGKSRLFRMLIFISKLISGQGRLITTKLKSTFKFEVIGEKKKEEVKYELNIEPNEGKNFYYEEILRNTKSIYSSKNKELFNETKRKTIKNFFIPKNMPALTSIEDPEFITIKLLKEFFQRFVSVSSERTKDIQMPFPGTKPIVPDAKGQNIAFVLDNWSELYPGIFNEVINELKKCFSYIEKIHFVEPPIKFSAPGVQISKLLSLRENNINKEIIQSDWSDGIYRMLHLLMSAKAPFIIDGKIKLPSVILIDEIENGLDFKTLKYVVNYLKDCSEDSQIIMSSHSPLVCDFVNPNDWVVARRKGSKINYLSPKYIEKNLNADLELFKFKHWEFYTKHISNSKLYRVK